MLKLTEKEAFKMLKRALILTWSGFQDHELVYPYYRLLGDGFEVKIVGDKRDASGRFYGIFGLNMPCHLTFSEFTRDVERWHAEADLLVLPGGVKALEKLRLENEAKAFIRRWHEEGKVISSTCHGAQLLISAGIARGQKIAGYYSLEDDVRNSGAEYSRDPVVVSSRIVSSPHYDHMGPWMEVTLEEYYRANEQ